MDRSYRPSELLANKQSSKSIPPWRDHYKQRCRQRLKQRRFDHMFKKQLSEQDAEDEAFARTKDVASGGGAWAASTQSSQTRVIVQEVMSSEWRAMRWEMKQDAEISSGDLPIFLDLMEELDAELKAEEAAIVEQYKESKQFDESDLCTALQALSTNELLCPICKRNPLFQNKSVVFCACGLRIDTEQDALTLDYVREQLEEGTEQHAAQCNQEPAFSAESMEDLQLVNLILHCSHCWKNCL